MSNFVEQEEEPILVRIIRNSEGDYKELCERQQEELSLLREGKDNATAKLIESQAKWTSFAKDILAISKELLKAINTLQANKPIPQEFLQQSSDRIQKYDAFLNESNLTFSNGQPEEPGMQPQGESQVRRRETGIQALDYARIKVFLKTSKDDENVCLMLQALRMRLLKTNNPRRAKQMIQEFIKNDLLDCENQNSELLKKLLKHHNKR